MLIWWIKECMKRWTTKELNTSNKNFWSGKWGGWRKWVKRGQSVGRGKVTLSGSKKSKNISWVFQGFPQSPRISFERTRNFLELSFLEVGAYIVSCSIISKVYMTRLCHFIKWRLRTTESNVSWWSMWGHGWNLKMREHNTMFPRVNFTKLVNTGICLP